MLLLNNLFYDTYNIIYIPIYFIYDYLQLLIAKLLFVLNKLYVLFVHR